jgi:DnaJ homolog subfamily C member 9
MVSSLFCDAFGPQHFVFHSFFFRSRWSNSIFRFRRARAPLVTRDSDRIQDRRIQNPNSKPQRAPWRKIEKAIIRHHFFRPQQQEPNTTMHVIHEAFGEDANLYEILHVDTQSVVVIDQAGLRKAYYKTALMYHPDKNQNNNNAMAVKKFQAVTAAYQILQDADKRQIYDETGEFGGLDDDDDDNDIGGTNGSNNNPWMDYFDRIFGRVTVDGIAEFAQTYKCSEEEKSHVLEQYVTTKGNMVKMLDYVMLSTARDAQRWVHDYLRPAIAAGTITDQYQSTMEKTFQKLQAKVKKEQEEQEDEKEVQPPRQQQQDDDEPTESDDDDRPPAEATSSKKKKQQQQPKKPAASSQKRKKAAVGEEQDNNNKKKKNGMSSLIAQIQNKSKHGSSNSMADFAARYGVTDFDAADDDPLADDDAFRRAQAHVVQRNNNNHQKNTKKKPPQPQRKRK